MIKKLLIANRGEIAIRIIKTCKLLNIKTVAIYSLDDNKSLHIEMADECVCTGFEDGYININNIIQAAINTGCDAIHPGYGFLSENYEFAVRVKLARLTFIGPDAEVIKLTENKNAMKELAKSNDVNVIDEFSFENTTNIQFPVLIKSIYGAGGKDIKKIDNAQELESFVTQNEKCLNRFFIEKYIDANRHIEIQFASDKLGNVVIFPERDCSIQNNYQKIIEITPSSGLNKNVIDKIKNKTNELIKKIKYVGVGTAEFLIDNNNNFYFIEINPRIQVEHAISEVYANVDFVKIQIDILNSKSIENLNRIDYSSNHNFVMEARIYAKNSPNNCVKRFEYNEDPNIRVDSCICEGMRLNYNYDTLLFKAIAKGNTREEMINNLYDFLNGIKLIGVDTNLHEVITFLKCPKFILNEYDLKTYDEYIELMTKKSLTYKERMSLICDDDSFEELESDDNKNLIIGTAKINDKQVAIGIMDSTYKAGSLDVETIKKILYLISHAKSNKLPLIFVSSSGGIRVQNGVSALLGMSKMALAIKEFKETGLFISFVTNPTYGGLNASLSSLGDVIIAEENSMIGFSGKKIIQNEIGDPIPEDFQTAEFNLKNGLIDAVVSRAESKEVISRILTQYNKTIKPFSYDKSGNNKYNVNKEELIKKVRSNEHIRPQEIVNGIFDSLLEIHGDRDGNDDNSVKCYFAKLDDDYISIVAIDRTNNLEDNMINNYGMIGPHGFRKILRFFKLSEKFNSPIVTFVDTPGADPTVDSEKNGQASAIAVLLEAISSITVPIMSFITGEANSGGAISLVTSDYLAMLKNSFFSAISPEGYKDIVFKEGSEKDNWIEDLRITPYELLEDGIIDEIIDDEDQNNLFKELTNIIKLKLYDLSILSKEELLSNRKNRIKKWGKYE